MARAPRAVIADINFDEDPERDEMTIVMLSSDLGFTVDYAVFTDSVRTVKRPGMTILHADLSESPANGGFAPLMLGIIVYDDEGGIEIRVKYQSEMVLLYLIHRHFRRSRFPRDRRTIYSGLPLKTVL
jgi:hypothetical protein